MYHSCKTGIQTSLIAIRPLLFGSLILCYSIGQPKYNTLSHLLLFECCWFYFSWSQILVPTFPCLRLEASILGWEWHPPRFQCCRSPECSNLRQPYAGTSSLEVSASWDLHHKESIRCHVIGSSRWLIRQLILWAYLLREIKESFQQKIFLGFFLQVRNKWLSEL